MDIIQIQTLIGSYGFPIVVTGYLLWERKQVIGEFAKSLNDVRAVLAEIKVTLRGE